MKNFTKFLLTGVMLIFSSSLLWSQNITTNAPAVVDYSPATRAVLYEQQPNPGGNAWASQEFGDFTTYSCEAADDFVVPTTWNITTVTAWGTRWNGSGPSTNLVNVNFYENNGGLPANVPIYSFLHVSATNSGSGLAIVYTITLPSTVTLSPGTYWLGVAEVADFSTVGQFGRVEVSPVQNNAFAWRNPGGGFGLGTAWNPGTILGGAPLDLSFRLEGTMGASASCDYQVALYDTYGDGWNGGALNVFVDGVQVLFNVTLGSGYGPAVYSFPVTSGASITTTYIPGSWAYENWYTVINSLGVVVFQDGDNTYTAPPVGIGPGQLYASCPSMGDVEGYVFNYHGLPVSGASIYIEGGPSTLSDPTGFYRLEDLYSGDVVLNCVKEGYNFASATVEIIAGETVYYNFTLTQPNMVVQPLIVEQTLNPNEYFTFSMSVLNNGNGPLGWAAQVVYPEEDNSGASTVTVGLHAGPADAPQQTAAGSGTYNARPAGSYTLNAGNGLRANPNVLLLNADDDNNGYSPIQILLNNYGDLGVVDLFDARYATPTLDYLLTYNVVIVWANYTFSSAVGMGNVLADYVDAGGRVINLMFALDPSWGLQGRFVSEGYSAMNGTGTNYSNSCLGTYNDSHPIMAGVTNVCDYYRCAGTYLTAGSSTIAQWGDGLIFVAAKDNKTVVSMGGYVGTYYQWTGQMPDVLHNAILWLASGGGIGGWLTMDYYEGIVPPFGGVNNIPTHLDASGTEAGQVYTASIVFTSDPNVATITVPVTMIIAGNPLNPPDNLTVTLVNDLIGQVYITWTWEADAFQYFLVKRDGVVIGTTTSMNFTDFIPDYGTYCYTVQAVYDEGQTVPAGPECVEWAFPVMYINPMSLEAWVWVNHQAKVYTTISNLGIGTLQYTFPDFADAPDLYTDYTINLPAGPAEAAEQTAVATGAYQARPESAYTLSQRNGSRAGANVLLVSADPATNIQALLQGYGDLESVDWFNAQTATPTLAQLEAYEVVITWSNYTYSNPAGMGDVLADYVDGGGKVINLMFSMGTHGWQMGGRFMTQNYTAMNGTSLLFTTLCLGTYDDGHPIMEGITSACDYYHVASGYLTTGSTAIARYTDNSIFVAAKDDQTVVSINGYVGNSYMWSGQMPDIVHNAINWLAVGGNFIITVNPATGYIPEGGSQLVEITYDATDFPPGTYYEDLIVNSNDPNYEEAIIFNTMHVYTPAAIAGTVLDCNNDEPLIGVTVSAGPFQTFTDNDGEYMLYVDPGTYTVYFQKIGYETGVFPGVNAPEGVTTIINTCLWDAPYPPAFVHAEVMDEDTWCEVTWALPAGPYEISMDDGTAEDLVLFQFGGSQNAVKFTPAGYPAVVVGGTLYVGPGTFPGPFLGTQFSIVVYDDDGPGGFPGTMLDSIGVTVNNYNWVVFDGLYAAVEDGSFYISMLQTANSPNAAPLGVDMTLPTYFRSYTKIGSNDWALSVYQDFMIRAHVAGPATAAAAPAAGDRVVMQRFDWGQHMVSASGNTPRASSGVEQNGNFRAIEGIANRAVEEYYIAIFEAPAGIIDLSSEDPLDNLPGLLYQDYAWEDLPQGWYAYGVQAIYSSGNSSPFAFSNIVGHLMDFTVTINVALSTGEEPSGVQVSMTPHNFPFEYYAGVTPETGTLEFDPVWKGVYTIKASKLGFDTYLVDFYITADKVINIVLGEVKYKPTNLYVDPLTLIATWNEPYVTVLPTETFEDPTFPPIGWMVVQDDYSGGWTRADQYSSSYWTVPSGDGYFAFCNDDGFPSHSGRNDRLITPVMNLQGAEGFVLSFEYFYDGAWGGSSYLEYSTDDGSSWTQILQFPPVGGWTLMEVDLADLSGVNGYSEIWFAFHFDDNGWWADGMAVDNVSISVPGVAANYIDFYLFIDDAFSGVATETTYDYAPLNYGQTYTASVAARYSSGLSAKDYYRFTSVYLFPPLNLTAIAPDDAAILMWSPPFEPGDQMTYTTGPAPQGGSVLGFSSPDAFVTDDGSGQPGGSRVLTECPEESFFSYVVDLDNATVAITSEMVQGTPYKVYQKVSNLPDQVGKITFWGLSLTYSGGWFVCSGEDPVTFLVEFWEDGSFPGDNIATYLVEAEVTFVGNLWGSYPTYEYSVTFPNVTMETGYISIQGQAPTSGPDCTFLWVSTEANYGPTWQWNGSSYTDPGYGVSVSICLSRGTGGGPGGGGIPANLLGYNVYHEGDFIAYVAHPDTNYVHEDLEVGEHCYDVTAVYDLSVYGYPGETGESMKEGQACAIVDYCFPLEFVETWSLGNLDANQWSTDAANWRVNGQAGNPAPAAEFTWDPIQLAYEKSLTSYPLCADMMTEGDIWLDYDYKLNTVTSDTLEFLNVQLWNWTSQTWVTVRSYNNGNGNITWTTEHLNINNFAMGKVFRIRFQAAGANSLNILSWFVDNVRVYRTCEAPKDLTADETYPGILLNWVAPQGGGGGIAEWIHWDSGTNYGAIGLSGTAPFTFDVAARWDAAQLAAYDGAAVTQISFFSGVTAGSATYRVRVWVGASATLVADQPVATVVTGAWNTVTLTTPVPIDVTQSLWVGYQTTHTTNEFPAGYDAGPAIAGYGDMIYFNNAWQTLSGLGYSYNWNIQAYVMSMAVAGAPQPIQPGTMTSTNATVSLTEAQYHVSNPLLDVPQNGSRDLTGYNIWRSENGSEYVVIGFSTETTYLDPRDPLIIGTNYCYMIQAVYAGEDGDVCESAPTEEVCVLWTAIPGNLDGGSAFNMYPNPASDFVTITSGNDLKRVTVYNALGQLVLDEIATGNRYELETATYTIGVYMVRVETVSGVITRTLAVQR